LLLFRIVSTGRDRSDRAFHSNHLRIQTVLLIKSDPGFIVGNHGQTQILCATVFRPPAGRFHQLCAVPLAPVLFSNDKILNVTVCTGNKETDGSGFLEKHQRKTDYCVICNTDQKIGVIVFYQRSEIRIGAFPPSESVPAVGVWSRYPVPKKAV